LLIFSCLCDPGKGLCRAVPVSAWPRPLHCPSGVMETNGVPAGTACHTRSFGISKSLFDAHCATCQLTNRGGGAAQGPWPCGLSDGYAETGRRLLRSQRARIRRIWKRKQARLNPAATGLRRASIVPSWLPGVSRDAGGWTAGRLDPRYRTREPPLILDFQDSGLPLLFPARHTLRNPDAPSTRRTLKQVIARHVLYPCRSRQPGRPSPPAAHLTSSVTSRQRLFPPGARIRRTPTYGVVRHRPAVVVDNRW